MIFTIATLCRMCRVSYATRHKLWRKVLWRIPAERTRGSQQNSSNTQGYPVGRVGGWTEDDTGITVSTVDSHMTQDGNAHGTTIGLSIGQLACSTALRWHLFFFSISDEKSKRVPFDFSNPNLKKKSKGTSFSFVKKVLMVEWSLQRTSYN